MSENKKKSFPKIKKTIKGNLTNNSKNNILKDMALVCLGTSLLTTTLGAQAACDYNNRCTDYTTYTYGSHSNQCITTNYPSTVYANHVDANIYTCGIVTSSSVSHLSLAINGHMSSNPVLNATFGLGKSYAPVTHASHCSTSCCC